jgi:adenosylcobinamide-GDP ribazoletransferase
MRTLVLPPAVADGHAFGRRVGRRLAVGVIAATAILTRVPIRASGDVAGGWAFGIVGAGIGAAAAVPVTALAGLGPPIGAVVALAVIVIVTGALHLDGLADTADALVAPTPEAAERARADPRPGSAGVAALLLILGLEWILVTALSVRQGTLGAAVTLVAASAVSRAAAPLAVVLFTRVGRRGFGQWFAERTTTADGVIAAATVLALVVVMGLVTNRSLLAVVATLGLLVGVAIGAALSRLRRGLDGDGYGATIELTFAAALMSAVALS